MVAASQPGPTLRSMCWIGGNHKKEAAVFVTAPGKVYRLTKPVRCALSKRHSSDGSTRSSCSRSAVI